jgi:hypothetical protein
MGHLVQTGIYEPDHKLSQGTPVRPGNYEELKRVIETTRPNETVTDDDFEKFENGAQKNKSEGSMQTVHATFELILTDPTLLSADDLSFNNIKVITDGLIPKPQPDYYDGASMEDLDRTVLRALNKYIQPHKDRLYPIVPNFLVQAKSGKGQDDTATQQIMYFGAVGARAMYHLQSYKGSKVFDNNAYTIVCQVSRKNLEIYTSHPTLRDGRVIYRAYGISVSTGRKSRTSSKKYSRNYPGNAVLTATKGLEAQYHT